MAEYTKALAFTGQLQATSIKDLRPTSSATSAVATTASSVGVDASESVKTDAEVSVTSLYLNKNFIFPPPPPSPLSNYLNKLFIL